MFNDFTNLCIFSLFVISIINRLTLDDGDFVCCHVISEMLHALETRLPFYKWRHKYLLNLHDCVTMVKAMPVKVGCSNKISPLLHSYFYFQIVFLSHNLILPIISMTCSCFGCVVDNLVPRALNFFRLSLKKKMPWVPYVTAFVVCGGNFCF